MHSDLVIVWETQGDHLLGHERTAARERCAQAMHCVAETFQQLSRVFRTAGCCQGLRAPSLLLYSTVSASTKRLGAENRRPRAPASRCSGPVEFTTVLPAGLLPKDRSFSRRVHQGQLIRESLTLSPNDSAIFLRFFRTIDDLDRLPYRNMPASPEPKIPFNMPLTAHSAT